MIKIQDFYLGREILKGTPHDYYLHAKGDTFSEAVECLKVEINKEVTGDTAELGFFYLDSEIIPERIKKLAVSELQEMFKAKAADVENNHEEYRR